VRSSSASANTSPLANDHDAPVGVVEVTAVSVVPFGQVLWEFADAEGEGFTSIGHWRDSHARFWAGQGAAVDTTPRWSASASF
jgi:uncharacterized protein YhfF